MPVTLNANGCCYPAVEAHEENLKPDLPGDRPRRLRSVPVVIPRKVVRSL